MNAPIPLARNTEGEEKLWLGRTAAVLLLFLLLRLISLWYNSTELFFDEAQYWVWAQEPDFGYFSKPPVLAWVIAIFTGICGNGEFCVRLPSPLLHTGTAFFIYLAGKRLFDARTAFVAALLYITLPAVSLSSTLISTDVPLLFFWSAALYFFLRLEAEDTPLWALATGLALGAGLMSKYAMIYFLPCAILYCLLVTERPHLLVRRNFWLMPGVAALCVLPNLWWNYANGFVTASHTGTNIGWGGEFPQLRAFAEFFLSQFAVFGPILFGIYLAALARLPREGMNRQQLFLLSFSAPILALICLQALMSKAYANWAALTYVAATLLVADLMVNRIPSWWLRLTIPLHVGVFVVLAIAVVFGRPGQLPLPAGIEPFARMQGARETAQAARARLDEGEYAALLTDDRRTAALMHYYLRDLQLPKLAWRNWSAPTDHFELTRAYQDHPLSPVLYLTRRRNPAEIVRDFADVEFLGDFEPEGGEARHFWLYRLTDYQPAPAGQ